MTEKYEISNKLENQDFSDVLDYLDLKYKSLTNNYSEDGIYREHCGLIATDIAKLFMNKGLKPELFSVRGQIVDKVGNSESIRPKRYNGQVTWGGHTVCVLDGIVYDPIIGKPIPIELYKMTAFEKEVRMYVQIEANKMEEFVKN